MVRDMILSPPVRMTLPRCLLLVHLLLCGPVAAQGIPLIQGATGPLLRQAQPLVQPREGEGSSTGASLFAGLALSPPLHMWADAAATRPGWKQR